MVKNKPVFYDLAVKIEKFRPTSEDIKDYITAQHAVLADDPKGGLSLNQYLKEKYFSDNNVVVALYGIIYAGEACDIDTGTYWSNNYKLYNYYGPTEITIYASSKQIIDGNTNLIGSAISNAKCYVLDVNLSPLPIGAIGELYIGGAGLARGYLNRPDLTAEKFIVNPFQSTEEKKLAKNARLYKTGDLVRWLADGNLEYIGRNDFQVKIRGYRIELGEIESVLSSYEGITQSVVLAKEQQGVGELGSKYLAGYYVSESKLDEEAILNYLQARLPEYMIPAVLMHLERLPLTINGKLDRKSLPSPEFTNIETYVAPRNELENQVCRIWAEVLGLPEDKVGVWDNFFRLGGNSIVAIRLISRLNNYYQSHLKISDIFIYKNIELLLPRIMQTKNSYQTIIKLNNTSDKPNIFMIHPATGGCEVYISLANTLANDFSCYGIDYYNLYQKNKIDNLHKLAQYYLSYIDSVMLKTQQKTFHLLGWSLGGKISLEIASILEQRAISNIRVYLLDTMLNDDYLLSLTTQVNIEKLKSESENYMLSQGYEKVYTEKIVSNIEIEMKLGMQKISSTLIDTRILLFKAMLKDTMLEIDDVSKNSKEYSLTLEYNNIDTIVEKKSNIKLIKINNAHHGNILNQKEFLAFEISKYNLVLGK